MSSVRRKHELLRDECNRRAEAAWGNYLRKDISEEERADTLDQYHALRVMADMHARTVVSAADIYPVKHTRQNVGPQASTISKLDFVRSIIEMHPRAKRQALALLIWDHADGQNHFKTYEAVYRFLGRRELF
jgi:hypothetical protein